MGEADLAALARDIFDHGLDQPICLTPDGRILDGRNRLAACDLVGIEPEFTVWEGEESDAVAFVLSRNLHRRHLDASQRAMVAGRIANLSNGHRQPSPIGEGPPVTQAAAAGLVNVGKRSVERARDVLTDGCPELVAAVENGEVAVSVAADLCDTSHETQREALKNGKKGVAVAAKTARKRKRERKQREAAPDLELTIAPVELPILSGAPALPSYVLLEDWKAMEAEARAAVLQPRASKKQFNKQSTASIEWAQWSWNPVTGCRHDCPYCYARDIANQKFPQGFEPAILPDRFAAPENTKVPAAAAEDVAFRNVFTCSMADLFGRWVPREWIEVVLGLVGDNPQWNFLFLTKFPKRYVEFEFPKNAWLGTTVDCQARVKNAEDAFSRVTGGTRWLSVEPLLEPLRFTRLDLFNWVVIGGASASTQTPRWIPPIDWVADLHCQARAAGCRIYYKDNCGMADDLRIREFPWEEPKRRELPQAFHYLQGLGE